METFPTATARAGVARGGFSNTDELIALAVVAGVLSYSVPRRERG